MDAATAVLELDLIEQLRPATAISTHRVGLARRMPRPVVAR